jgi:hypothetical protein
MSRYDPWEIARLKLVEYNDERDIDEMTWVEAEKIAETYEELEEKIDDVAQGIAEVIQEALENSVHWQVDSVLTNDDEILIGIVENKLLEAALAKLVEGYAPVS